MIGRVYQMASLTLRQVIRQRLFVNVAIFGLFMIVAAVVISNITFGVGARVVRSIGLSGVTVALDLMAILLAVGIVHADIDRKTLFVLFTRPLTRVEYIVGRFFGLSVALLAVLLGFGVILALSMNLSRTSFTGLDAVVLSMSYVEALILTAFGLVLSSFTTPTVGAGIGLGFWVAISSTDDLVGLASAGESIDPTLATALATILPNLSKLDFREFAVRQLEIAPTAPLLAAGYGLLWVLAFLAIASVVLSRREMV